MAPDLSALRQLQNNINKGLFVGQNFVYLDEVDSTNKFLKDSLTNSKPPPEGTVIMAGQQTAGRGQKNTSWISEPYKNVTASIILKPTFLDTRLQFFLSRIVCLALVKMLTVYISEKISIKWPNDIYVHGRKICGVLIENTLSGTHIRNSIIGIGLNVNQENFPQNIGAPTSMKLLLQHDFDLKELIDIFCKNLEAGYLNLRAGGLENIHLQYDGLLFQRNQNCLYEAGGTPFSGTIKGTTKEGLLIMETETGIKTFGLKEIMYKP